MYIVYFGIVVFVVGVIMVFSFEQEKDIKMVLGEIVEVVGYIFIFNGVKIVEGLNYVVVQGDFDFVVNGKFQWKMNLEKCDYYFFIMLMIEVVIDVGFLCDVYVLFGELIDCNQLVGEWVVCVYYKFFVDWVWGGCVLMVLGGLLVMFD